MTIFDWHFHKFKPLYELVDGKKQATKFRRCIKCGLIQDYIYNSKRGRWKDLPIPIQNQLNNNTITIDGSLLLD
jgi:hypothetical protein